VFCFQESHTPLNTTFILCSLLINGKPIDYALARIPAKGNFKGNLAAGALGVGQPLSKRDYKPKKAQNTSKVIGFAVTGSLNDFEVISEV
jgi:glutathione synthase/RimK-type ligase-like ATP-grasp enzyme